MSKYSVKVMITTGLIFHLYKYLIKFQPRFDICFFPQTASHIKARHELLEGAIGVFPEEKQAYEKISILSWLLPLIAIIGALVDIILVVVFMKFAHPWKDILFSQPKETEEAQTIESTDIQEEQSKTQVRCYLLFKNR